MLNKITDRVALIFLSILSIVLCLDLFLHHGTPTTFDAPTHITNLVMINTGLRSGEFPVTWNNTFANYGLPMPLIIQQTTAYAGGLLLFFVSDPVLAYHLVLLFFTLSGAYAMYAWLRCYATPAHALVATALYTVAPYKMVNIYARGALPEYAAAMFLPLIAFAIYQLILHKKTYAIPLLGFSVGLLFLTHPMVAIVGAPFLSIYAFYLIITNHNQKLQLLFSLCAIVLGVGLAGYYLLPLQSEIKYFIYGTYPTNLKPNEFLTLPSLWTYTRPYWSDIPTRGYTLRIGITEQIILVMFGMACVFRLLTFLPMLSFPRRSLMPERVNDGYLFLMLFIIVLCYIFLLSPLSLPIYQASPTLANIQYPTRMLTGLMTIIPLIAILLMQSSRKLTYLITALTIITILIRLPDAHGKNYLDQPRSEYSSSVKNMHGNFLNTIWMEAPEHYPLRSVQAKILSGDGTLTIKSIENTIRNYHLEAITSMQLIDYTFFFPGWKVYANGQEIPIEFQDVAQRGVITYRLEPGTYDITVKFIPTRIRKYGWVVSSGSLLALVSLTFVYNNLNRHHLHTISRK